MNWKKILITGTLATTLTFSSMSAMAVKFDDVTSGETSISKLVSLGIVVNKAKDFNPEKSLTRQEFAEIAGRIMKLTTSSKVKLNDTKDAAAIKAVSSGILTVGAKGDFKPKNAITYADLARGLAFGLGFKKTWSNRPIDHLYFLERKGVLSIDTDLDEVVTREEAAIAIDTFMEVQDAYVRATGVVESLNGNVLKIKTDSGFKTYKFSSNISLFLDEQYAQLKSLARGTIIHLTLNKKGEIAYAAGNSLDLLDGPLGYSGGNLTFNGQVKNWLLNGLVKSLPNSSTVPFTFTEFGNYAKNGVSFSGTLYSDTVSDEITVLEPYITKIPSRLAKIENNKLVFDFSDVALKSQTFSFDPNAKLTLVEGETKTEVQLADIVALQTAGKKFNATLTSAPDGLAKTVEFTEKK